jgi:phosphoglycolate phosphatase
MTRMISGRLVTGRGEAAGFTQQDWVRRQMIEHAGIDPYPGTINIRLDEAASIAAWATLRAAPSAQITPPSEAYCSAQCIPVRVGGLAAAAIVPDIPNYPDDVVEVIAGISVREQLKLADDHEVSIDPWSPKRVRACVFDVDGTMLDSVFAYYQLALQAAQPFGYTVTLDHVRHALTTGSSFWTDVVPDDVPDRPARIKEMMRAARAIWMPVLREHARTFPGLATTLETLKNNGIALGIMTNASPDLIEHLREAGVAHYFSAIVTNADVKNRKPDPEGILRCLDMLGVAPADAAYVGDTPLDIDASNAAGVHAFGVTTGATDCATLTRAGAHRLLANLDSLPAQLLGPL